jgi:branched-chain amino acid transport system permease protein
MAQATLDARGSNGLPPGALRDALITFGLALLISISIVGLRTEVTPDGLALSTHLPKAIGFAAAIAFFRFLIDVLLWRRGADSLAALMPRFAAIGRGVGVLAVAAGAVLFALSGTRTELVASARNTYWLLGTAADLVTLACMAAFSIVAAMLIVRVVRVLVLREREAGQSFVRSLTHDLGREFALGLFLIAIALPFLVTGPEQRYALDTATQVLIYVMLGWGLNVVVGLAGLLDLGYVAFYAVGAYSYALLATQFGWSFWVCLPLAGLFAALWGIILGFPVLRLRGDYLAIVTLAFGEIIRILLLNWQSLTGGPNGITNIPRPEFFGLSFSRGGDNTFHEFFGLEFDPIYRVAFFYYLILALAMLTNLITLKLRRLPIGRAWEALREDEIACRSLGINTVTTKLTAFAIGAMFGGFAGSFFATRQGFISPESFTFQESAFVLAIVVLGGLGSQMGVVVASVALVGGMERFRELQDYRMIILGLAMVLIMTWRPRGLVSGRTPTAVLKERKKIASDLVQQGHG